MKKLLYFIVKNENQITDSGVTLKYKKQKKKSSLKYQRIIDDLRRTSLMLREGEQ